MKKTLAVIMAALSMLLTQCKKSEEAMPSAGEPVNITLNVGGNSKIGVNTGEGQEAGTVIFANGDKIYVASGGKYVGTLTYSGSVFSGSVTNPTKGEPLWFYLLGNKTPSENNLTEGETDTFTVDISDQRGGLPVISFAKSDENYPSENHSYNSKLKNQCALVGFEVEYYNEGDVTVKGLFNQVTVNLSDNSFGYGYTGGVITLHQESNEYKKTEGGIILQQESNQKFWAILLPQKNNLNNVTASCGSVTDQECKPEPGVEEIKCNDFIKKGFTVTLDPNSGRGY